MSIRLPGFIAIPSSLLVGALVLSLIACSSDRERSHPSTIPDTKAGSAAAVSDHEPAAPAEQAMLFEGPGEKLPRESGGWAIASAPRYFGPDNLYDLINGGAEIYTEFGLARMVTADYANPGRAGITITAEIYDMATVEGAFGRTARFLEGRQDPSKAGEGLPSAWADKGILGVGDLLAWKDRFLVHLTLLDESPTADADSIDAAGRELLPAFAEAVLALIDSDPPLPADLGRFPTGHRLMRSEAWSPAAPGGIGGLGAGYTVRYEDGDKSWTAFATAAMNDEAQAETAWKALLADEAPGRRIAARVAGKRLVGAMAEGDDAPGMERLEAFTRDLVAAFSAD